MNRSPVSRRVLMLGLVGLGMSGGCSSADDRINNLVFSAIKKDPLYLWRPGWATSVIDREFPIGGIPSETRVPRFNHDLQASEVPGTAESEAVSVALQSGWHAESDAFTYMKPIEGSSMVLVVDFATSIALKILGMNFAGGNA